MYLLTSAKNSSRDIRLLWFSVFVRLISFGLTNQVLTLYLKELGIKESSIGLFMSLTMIGDSVLSYLLTWNSNKIGNRRVMIFGSILMFLSGLVFASGTSNFTILLIASIFGVISPSGNETGPFKTIEESVLAKLTPPNHRPEIYAIHWVLASAGSAIGSLSGGALIQHLTSNLKFTYREAYKTAFYFYCAISLIKSTSMLFLSSKCEPSYIPLHEQRQPLLPNDEESISRSYNSSQLSDSSDSTNTLTATTSPNNERRVTSVKLQSTIVHNTFTGLSPETQNILLKLLYTFMLDSFGYGFMPSAWVIYYFKTVFGVAAITLGLIFSTNDVLQSLSAIPSALMSSHWGPIKSTIMTQIPCGIFFILIPILGGNNIYIATILYFLNQSLSATDVVPRQILLTSIIQSNDLPKVLGTVNIGKQVARSLSPYFTGLLATYGYLWICFIISGTLLITANVILAFNFRNSDAEIMQKQSIHQDIEQ